jgi:D-alanine-D-alanine ligase
VRIVVLRGGISGEAEISRLSGAEVAGALRQRGHAVTELEFEPGAVEVLRRDPPDLVFPVLHGPLGEDGTAAAMLEMLGLPYVGSGILAGALAMNKIAAKRVWTALGLPTPEAALIERGEPAEAAAARALAVTGLPAVVKPNSGGSSLGLTIAREEDALLDGVRLALRLAGPDGAALVEAFKPGVEVTVGVLGVDEPEALPTLEIVYETGSYDFEAKYTAGRSRHIIPARVSEGARARAAELAVAAHRAIGARGLSRVDVICQEDGAAWLLELNTMPGMTALSLFPDAARAAGLELPDLVERLVQDALRAGSAV